MVEASLLRRKRTKTPVCPSKAAGRLAVSEPVPAPLKVNSLCQLAGAPGVRVASMVNVSRLFSVSIFTWAVTRQWWRPVKLKPVMLRTQLFWLFW